MASKHGIPQYRDAQTIQTCLNAGVDPNTGNAIKFNPLCASTPEEFLMGMRVLDEQQAVNRYVWTGLPSGLTGQLLERVLYYRSKLCFFHLDNNDYGGTFYALPFNGVGEPDVYGNYQEAVPLPFNGKAKDKKENDPWIPGLRLKIQRDLHPVTLEDYEDSCVVLYDYSRQLSQTILTRQTLQDPILRQMAEIFPMVRTNMMANSGVRGMRVNSDEEAFQVSLANESIADASMNGKYLIPIIGHQDFQDFTNNQRSNAQDYLLTMQSYDNYRLQMYGLKNGGLFDKSAYVNNIQAGNEQANVELQYQDGLTLRQNFCKFINYYFNLSTWCDSPETVQGNDLNMDGRVTDDHDDTRSSMSGQEVSDVQRNM